MEKQTLWENFIKFVVGDKELDSTQVEVPVVSFAPPKTDEGEIPVLGSFNHNSIQGVFSANDKELIEMYRRISRMPEVSTAIDEIVGEMVSENEKGEIISLDFTGECKFSDSLKKKLQEEFKTILDVMKFKSKAQDYVRRWYIDGRINFHKVISKDNIKKGIQELRYINPLSLEKYVEYDVETEGGVNVYRTKEEYFVYDPTNRTNTIHLGDTSSGTSSGASISRVNSSLWIGNQYNFYFSNSQVLKVPESAIAFAPCGYYDEDFDSILSYLYPAIKIANNLANIEDAMMIYRLSRAPERRIFYIDIGNLSKDKGDQYIRNLHNEFSSKIAYDSMTGAIKDSNRFNTFQEDYWIPRRSNGRSTEISTLPGANNLGDIEDTEYFKRKLYNSLKVPTSRLNTDGTVVGLGRSSEITREELRFQKFIDTLRKKFNVLLLDIFKTQLMCKNVMDENEFNESKKFFDFRWSKDLFYTELKETEILRERLSTLAQGEQYIGRYISTDYVQKYILRMTEEEKQQLEKERKEMEAEGKDPDETDFDYEAPKHMFYHMDSNAAKGGASTGAPSTSDSSTSSETSSETTSSKTTTTGNTTMSSS